MPRLGHKKSRNGCRQCKARHVKCDESKPCSNCARHGVLCSLVDPNSGPVLPPPQVKREPSVASTSRSRKADSEPSRKSSDQSTPASLLPIDYVLNPSPAATTGTSESDSPQSDPYPYLSKFVNKSDVIQPNYWVRDLELMHHWVTEAHLTVSPREDIGHMWRITAPKQAISKHYLMHELLAYSALHLAYVETDHQRAFYGLGIHHQDLAIRSMRKVLPNLSADNAGALAVTSTLLTLTVFAARGMDAASSSNAGHNTHIVIEELLDIFSLVQGIGSILLQGAAAVSQGPFGALLTHPNKENINPPIFGHIQEQLLHLSSFLDTQDISPEAMTYVKTALGCIRDMLNQNMEMAADSKEIRVLFSSALRFPQGFCDMLRQRQSPALAVMSIWAAGLKASEPQYWFAAGWGERLIRAIGESIDPSWQPAIQWSWDYIVTELQPSQSTMNIDPKPHVHLQGQLDSHSGGTTDDLQHRMQEQMASS